jgi:hypothetical protein
MECELLQQCGFFKKYQAKQEAACQVFIMLYCRGSKMNECERKKFRTSYGAPPPDNMLPNGQELAC